MTTRGRPKKDPNAPIVFCPKCQIHQARSGNKPCLRCVRESCRGGLVCSICKELKPSSEFRIDLAGPRTSATGIRREYRCRRCNALRSRANRATPKGRYTQAKLIAKHHSKRFAYKSHIVFALTFEEYTALVSKPCHYCGGDVSPTGIGLDRKSNDQGYTTDNAVPCCPECNLFKSNMLTESEMLLIGPVLAKIKADRAIRGEPASFRTYGRKRKHFE